MTRVELLDNYYSDAYVSYAIQIAATSQLRNGKEALKASPFSNPKNTPPKLIEVIDRCDSVE